jgi:hypothetical protein
MNPPPRASVFAFAAVALALCACDGGTDELGDYALFRNAALADTVEVVLPPDVDSGLLRGVAAASERRVVFSASPRDPAAEGAPRILVADGRTAGLDSVLASLDLQRGHDNSFSFLDQTYTGADDVVVATIADPQRDGLPLTIYFGVDAAHAVHFVRDLTPAWRPAFRCWRDGRIEREGRWNEDGSIALTGASARLPALARAEVQRVGDDGFDLVVHGELDGSQVEAYRRTLRSVHREIVDLFGAQDAAARAPKLEVHLWGDAEALALSTGAWELSTDGPAPNQVHAALSPRSDGGFAAARAWAVELAGAPAADWMLDGIGLHVARAWWGQNQIEWVPFLVGAGVAPSVAELVDPRSRTSRHIAAPLRGALLDCWLARHDRKAFADAWRGAAAIDLPSDADLRAWAEHLNPALAAPDSRDKLRPSRIREVMRPNFRRGLQLAQPDDGDGRAFRGYGTQGCRDSLRGAIESGANSLALMPCASGGDGTALWAGVVRSEPFDTSTPDVALAAAIAQSGGMRVMLAPQLVTSRSGSWAGWSMSDSPATWDAFFERWKACVVHYALLAELCGADILCLGTELAPATRSSYSEADLASVPDYLRESTDRWREVIAAARATFRGALTYAANDQGEAKMLGFWSELDFVGVDVFHPLVEASVQGARPTDEQAIARLRGALQAVADVAVAQGKPALITEIGFAPTSESWKAPQRALGASDFEEQRRLYACLGEALRRQNASKTPLAGMFVWCWSTDPSAGRAADRSFTPQNRPAAAALTKVFGRR